MLGDQPALRPWAARAFCWLGCFEVRIGATTTQRAGGADAASNPSVEARHGQTGGLRRPTIFLVVRPGPGARFVLHTDILRRLLVADVSVAVLTPPEDMPMIAASLEGSPNVVILPLRRQGLEGRPGVARARVLLQRARRSALDGRKSVRFHEKHRSRMQAWSAKEPRLATALDTVIRFGLWRSVILRKLAVQAAVRAAPPLHSDLFDGHRPDLVVCTGLGYAPWDEGILQEASARGVKTAALVHNWDNPSTGGYRAAPLDLVVAWSDGMRRQLVEMQDVPSNRIRIAGVPHWDRYMRDGGVLSKEELFARLGLNPDRRLILHATHRPRAEVETLELAETLARATGDGSLDDAQLVIRIHPKFMASGHEPARLAFAMLERDYRGVHVNEPSMISGEHQEVDPSDIEVLGGLLKHCDVLVNVFSTTTLEAFLLDRPVVIADPETTHDTDSRPAVDTLAWKDYAHLQSILAKAAVPVAHNRDELLSQVRNALDDPTRGQHLRRLIAKEECGPADGFAGRRTADFLLEAVGLQPP